MDLLPMEGPGKYDQDGRCERVPGVVRETPRGNHRRDTSVPGFLPDPTGWRLSASVPVECPRDGLLSFNVETSPVQPDSMSSANQKNPSLSPRHSMLGKHLKSSKNPMEITGRATVPSLISCLPS